MARITISKNRLDKIIKESIRNVINEGVDFDETTLTVSYNPNHK